MRSAAAACLHVGIQFRVREKWRAASKRLTLMLSQVPALTQLVPRNRIALISPKSLPKAAGNSISELGTADNKQHALHILRDICSPLPRIESRAAQIIIVCGRGWCFIHKGPCEFISRSRSISIFCSSI
jgi:hypothetical protein